MCDIRINPPPPPPPRVFVKGNGQIIQTNHNPDLRGPLAKNGFAIAILVKRWWSSEPNTIYTLPRIKVCLEMNTDSLYTWTACVSQQFRHESTCGKVNKIHVHHVPVSGDFSYWKSINSVVLWQSLDFYMICLKKKYISETKKFTMTWK